MRRFVLPWIVFFHCAFGQSGIPDRVSLLAVGDINLGRHVGQMLLKDSLTYPFEFSSNVFRRYDFVVGNLESQITDQNGETQHPRDRFIFCAPPQAAQAIRNAGISAVATANNHAFDYKMKGLRETIQYLDEALVPWTGTSLDAVEAFKPVILERNGIRIGLLAYTQFVNRKTGWIGHIALFNGKLAQKEIDLLRSSVDLVVVSYHGGDEYKEEPNKRALRQMHELIEKGADVVIGHHPHVPQGIESYKGKWIFYSLGNFVFYQPQREWTQRGIAVAITFRRNQSAGGVELEGIDVLPLRAGFQPSFSLPAVERELLEERLGRLSNVGIIRKDTTFAVTQASYIH